MGHSRNDWERRGKEGNGFHELLLGFLEKEKPGFKEEVKGISASCHSHSC